MGCFKTQTQLGKNVVDMAFYGSLANRQTPGNADVGVAFGLIPAGNLQALKERINKTIMIRLDLDIYYPSISGFVRG